MQGYWVIGFLAAAVPTAAEAHCMDAAGYDSAEAEANGCEDLHDALDEDFGLQPFIRIAEGPTYKVLLGEAGPDEALDWSVFVEMVQRACEVLEEHPAVAARVSVRASYDDGSGPAGTLSYERSCPAPLP